MALLIWTERKDTSPRRPFTFISADCGIKGAEKLPVWRKSSAGHRKTAEVVEKNKQFGEVTVECTCSECTHEWLSIQQTWTSSDKKMMQENYGLKWWWWWWWWWLVKHWQNSLASIFVKSIHPTVSSASIATDCFRKRK